MKMVNILVCWILFIVPINADRPALNRNIALMFKQYQTSSDIGRSHHDNVIKFLMQNHDQTWAKPTTARCKKITTAIFSKKAVVLQRKPKTH